MTIATEAFHRVPLKRVPSRLLEMRRWARFWLVLPLLVGSDILGVFGAHFLAHWFRMHHFFPPTVPPPLEVYTNMALFLALMTPLLFLICMLYDERIEISRFDEAIHVVLGVSLVSVLEFTSIFFLRDFLPYQSFTFSRLVAVFSWGTSILLVFSLRWGVRWVQTALREAGWGVHRVLLFGTGTAAEALMERQRTFLQGGYLLTACVEPEPERLAEWVKTYQVDTLLSVQEPLDRTELFDLVILCQRLNLRLHFCPDFIQLTTAKLILTEIGGLPLVTVQNMPLGYFHNQILKRLFDSCFAASSLSILAPLIVAVGLSIKLTSPGPVFYKQERLSRAGRRFTLYKFRTMEIDGEKETGPVWAYQDDPRCTRIGRFLRRASLDELPQLWNVLKGEMSIVGPRPERPIFVEHFQQEILDYPNRHSVKAGITGWAQVNGLRGDTSIQERTRFDLYYIENWTLLFDLRIIFKSFYSVLQDYIYKRAY